MPPPYHGSCLCGEIAFEIKADPIVVSTCHCTNCKKFTGTVFTSNVVFPAGSADITKGASLVSTFSDSAQDSGNTLRRKFCSRCSSPLFNEGGNFGRTLAAFYSALDDFSPTDADGVTHDVKPQVEFYSKDRTQWVHPIDGAEQAITKPGREDNK